MNEFMSDQIKTHHKSQNLHCILLTLKLFYQVHYYELNINNIYIFIHY